MYELLVLSVLIFGLQTCILIYCFWRKYTLRKNRSTSQTGNGEGLGPFILVTEDGECDGISGDNSGKVSEWFGGGRRKQGNFLRIIFKKLFQVLTREKTHEGHYTEPLREDFA